MTFLHIKALKCMLACFLQ